MSSTKCSTAIVVGQDTVDGDKRILDLKVNVMRFEQNMMNDFTTKIVGIECH